MLDRSISTKDQKGTYSRDACLVVKRRFNSPCALAVQGRTKDPDAVLARPARHLFLVPWRDYTLVGVWHVVWKRHPDKVTVTEEEVSSFIDEINWAYPALKLTSQDVVMWNAGLVPFGDNDDDAENLSYGKRSHLTDHKLADGLDGLVTLIGIRYTTARGDTAKAIDMVCAKLGKTAKRAPTDYSPVFGGDIADFDELVEETFRNQMLGLTKNCVRSITHNHGTGANDVLSLAEKQKWMADVLGETQVLKAEVVYAVRNEMAQTLGDIVFRRTDLATGGNPGTEVLHECANILATELGWDDGRVQDEIAKVLQRFPEWTGK